MLQLMKQSFGIGHIISQVYELSKPVDFEDSAEVYFEKVFGNIDSFIITHSISCI